MSLMNWNASLMIGHAKIDEDHLRLVQLLNRLYDAMQAGKGREVSAQILGELIDYTKSHFAMEERLMAAHGYPKTVTHKAEHAALLAEVGEFRKKLESGQATLSVPLFKFLKDWLSNHILKSDRELVVALNARTAAVATTAR